MRLFRQTLYPILFLLSINAGQLPLQQAGRILLVSLFVALILTLLFGMVAKDFRRGGFLTSLLLALFFFYGHVYNWLEKSVSFLAIHTFLYVIWGILLLVGVWAAYKIRNIGAVTKYLNLLILFLLLQPMAVVGLFVYRNGIQSAEVGPFDEAKISDRNNMPDIYYIILDGHGRSDVVQELYDYDNSSFINHLRQRGFYVAEQSRSNYAQTAQSLSSSLNFNYLNLENIDPNSNERSQLAEWIRRSELRTFLRKQGYQTVAFSTGYDLTTLDHSDIFFPLKNAGGFNSFEGLVFSTSIVSALDPGIAEQWFIDPFRCENHRRYVLNVFENLKKIPDLPGPKFVFAHIISPHPPFIFGSKENDERTTCRMADGGGDGIGYLGEESEYKSGYSKQIEYIDGLVQEAVDIILEKSEVPPVIIIQADHGSGLLLDWRSSEKSCLRERFSILNAYYIPFSKKNQLYETITPVNSFRVVLNEIFNSQLPLLEDKSYYSTWDNPYKIEDVTNKIEASCR